VRAGALLVEDVLELKFQLVNDILQVVLEDLIEAEFLLLGLFKGKY
jgi:hypothetical protein